MSIEPVTSSTENHSTEPESEKGNLNGREVEAQQHMDNAKENFIEYAKDCIKASVPAGAAITQGALLPAVVATVIIVDGIPKFIEGCREYEEAVTIRNAEKGLDKFWNPLKVEKEAGGSDSNIECDRENDRDSWDREY